MVWAVLEEGVTTTPEAAVLNSAGQQGGSTNGCYEEGEGKGSRSGMVPREGVEGEGKSSAGTCVDVDGKESGWGDK